MTARKSIDDVIGLTAAQVANLLGHSLSWFSVKKRDDVLYPKGFPRPNPVTGRWNRDAVVAWDRRMAGLDAEGSGTVQSRPLTMAEQLARWEP